MLTSLFEDSEGRRRRPIKVVQVARYQWLRIYRSGVVLFCYTSDPGTDSEMNFEFSTLDEVGQPYQKAYTDWLASTKQKLHTMNIEQRPFVVQQLINA